MNKFDKKTWILITRKLSGELSPEDENKFHQWIVSDAEHEEFFKHLEASWRKDPGKAAEKFFFDHTQGLNRLREKISQASPDRPVSTAEAKESTRHFSSTTSKRKRISVYQGFAVAAILLIAIAVSAGGVLFSSHFSQTAESAMKQYVTSEEEQRIITLSDGSVVRLNRNSRLQLQNEPGHSRKAWLEGEAYFDIQTDPERPFTISSGDALVEVLGTSFNVKGGEKVLVAVEEGVVSLRNSHHEERSAALLSAGQLGILSSNGEDLKIETADVENYFSWLSGHIRFDRMPFEKVIRQLERIYDEEHAFENPEMASLRLTVYTEQIARDDVMEAIAAALDFSYTRDGERVVWRAGGNED